MRLLGQRRQLIEAIDVTQNSPIPLDFRELDQSPEGPHYLWFGTEKIGSPDVQWFFDDVITERIVKVVATRENVDGETVTLYQPIQIQTLALRSSEGIVLPTTEEYERTKP